MNPDVVARTELRHIAGGQPGRDIQIKFGRRSQAATGEWGE